MFEVVSPDDPSRDDDEKPTAYAKAGVGEYWIVDPERRVMTVLRLAGSACAQPEQFAAGETAVSTSLPGLSIDVSACFESAE